MAPRFLIFAYGTLMRGECRHSYLQGALFHGDATTLALYRLVNCGTYPGLLNAPTNGVAIRGEVWSIDQPLRKILDEVEGVDVGLYACQPVQLDWPFDEQRVLAYFYLRDTTHFPDCGPDWRQRTR